MTDKVIPWSVGDGNISLSYSGDKDGVITITSDENTLWEDRSMSIIINTTKGSPKRTKTIVLTQKGKTLVAGTTFNFDYTGSVQSIVLPKGKYKLQCWGAQGGGSFAVGSDIGSKGGYSEGVLTLTDTTTLYVFVGGKGSLGSTTSLVNGGWNGGGASVGHSVNKSGDEVGYSYPGCGGGATDIATITSSMSYSNGRTNRSSASLLSRIIVAGGGAGSSYRYTRYTEESTTTKTIIDSSSFDTLLSSGIYFAVATFDISAYVGKKITFSVTASANATMVEIVLQKSDGSYFDGVSANSNTYTYTTTLSSSVYYVRFRARNPSAYPTSLKCKVTYDETTSNTSTSSGYSNKSQQGGGISGKGQYPGTQSSAGNGGAFGLGASQTVTNYRYCSGGGGGGWYGGGRGYSDSSISYINYAGGGSGFVNTAANASYRPSGYTGLQLDSGTTMAGNTSHPSVSGGTETGHSGNGYAKITVIE